MSSDTPFPRGGRYAVGAFSDAGAFERALDDLIDIGFNPASVSILAPHAALADHFGDHIPDIAILEGRADTPRESLDTRTAIDRAIRTIAEGLSILSVLGAAGAAFAVGGPVGVAVSAGAATEASVESTLERFVDADYRSRFEASVREGGVIVWIHVFDATDAERALGALETHGGDQVHLVDLK